MLKRIIFDQKNRDNIVIILRKMNQKDIIILVQQKRNKLLVCLSAIENLIESFIRIKFSKGRKVQK